MDIDSTSLAPGFRFHPTDEELVRYYLRRKICKKPLQVDAISEIDIYKVEPWDLPDKSRLKSRDLEWYFFSALDKKYGNGARTNRATDRGYWKTTGKDRAVYHRSQIVGMKKTLVYHSGRAPQGKRSNWVMHEYRIVDEKMEKSGYLQDALVLCRIFQKSGSGPKNGEQYGAPYLEEEWENDELAIVPKVDDHAMELPVCDDVYLDGNDLEQILNAVDPLYNAPIAITTGDGNDYVEGPLNFTDNVQEACVVNDYVQKQPDNGAMYSLPVQYGMDEKSVNNEYLGEPSNIAVPSNTANPVGVDHMRDLSFVDATDKLPSGDGAYIETNDLQQPFNLDDPSLDMLDEYLKFFDATDDNLQNMGFEYSDMFGSEELLSDPAALFPNELYYQDASKSTRQETGGKQQFDGISNDFVSSSKKAQTQYQSGSQYQFLKQASNLLGDVSAPPALASEFPTKDATLRLNSASASSFHVSAGILQTRNVTLGRAGVKWSYGEHDLANIVLSVGLSRGDDTVSEKADSTVSWGWFYFLLMWVLLLSTSFKIGTYIYSS
ncbi:NAC domain-containing protein [Heracleum sosnowskyi]|uniref:NAC domain-containing protein n=1 Tax=Heracleum sosnowskyi TaxID=360622 RepID=A0AAD8J5A8_9APIA|nr:NAC domain-containing protein [Heracleum sosnowskyi]